MRQAESTTSEIELKYRFEITLLVEEVGCENYQ
jgi:hypothetical protein